MNSKINTQLWLVTGLIVITALSRLVPHLPNFSPIGAICLFGAAQFQDKKFAFIVPLLAIGISDILVNNIIYATYFDGFTIFYQGFQWQYLSYVVTVFAGMFIIKAVSFKSIAKGTLAATMIFFLISNFGVWMSGTLYPMNGTGLMSCYIAAIPFLGGTLFGNMIYSAILFASYAIIAKKALATN